MDATALTLNAEYQDSFGADKLLEVGNKFQKEHPFVPHDVPADYSRFWPAVWDRYWPTVLIWGIGLALWNQRKGAKVWIETPRIALASLFPGISLIVYPFRIDQTRQDRSAIEFACGLIIAVVSFVGAAAGSLAKAQTGFGDKSKVEEIKKKRKRFFAGTINFGVGYSSELPASYIGAIFNASPNVSTTVKLTLDNGFYIAATSWNGMDHPGLNANLGDWANGTVGYVRKFGRTTLTGEAIYLDAAPLQRSRNDFFTVRSTIAYALGKDSRYGTLSGTARGLWENTAPTIVGGVYGYLGYTRNVRIPGTPISLAPSTELRIDPGGNLRTAANRSDSPDDWIYSFRNGKVSPCARSSARKDQSKKSFRSKSITDHGSCLAASR